MVAADEGGGRLQIGFKHSGYTGPDPDGKNAFLTVTLAVAETPLSTAEREKIEGSGGQFDRSVNFHPTGQVTVDISCGRCPDVVNKVHADGGLPKTVPVGGSIPIQIRLQNVPGSNLYDILTASDGLQFQALIMGTLTRQIVVSTGLDSNNFSKWWETYSAGDSISWSGGVDPLLASLVDSSVLLAHADSKPSVAFPPSDAYISHIRSALSGLVSNGRTSLSKASLQGLPWAWNETTAFSAPVTATVQLSPGRTLIDHPEYVQDLTNDKPGLGAIKGPVVP